MRIGVPKEVKDNENRVGLTPAGAEALRVHGRRVLVEANAGVGSGFSDSDYTATGAEIVTGAPEVFSQADMIIKVKEPLPQEYQLLKEGQLLFTYLHLAAAPPELTRTLMDRGITAVAYETVQLPTGELPLLMPMSEVAGRAAVQIGAHFLEKPQGGCGLLLGGVPGVVPARVVIIGGGAVGTNAAEMAVGLGAEVTVLDVSAHRLRALEEIFRNRVRKLMSNRYNIARAVAQADLLIGAVLIPGARCPHLVTEEMVKSMRAGSVIVDIAVDQGGCIETIDRVTTHSDPTYVKHGVLHYAVANMPGVVPRTSTLALTNVTLPYAIQLAGNDLSAAIGMSPELATGVNTINGCCTHDAVAAALGLPYTPLHEAIG